MKVTSNAHNARSLWYAGAVFFVFALLLFSPPFFTWDSYHYMQLSLKPVVGDTHPLAFGMLLKTLAALSHFINDGIFLYLYIFYQSVATTFIFVPVVVALKENWNRIKSAFWTKQAVFLGLVIFVFVLAPGVIYLTNAVWSEITGLFLLSVLGILSHSIGREVRAWKIAVAALLGLLAYQTRYQMTLVPVCFVAMGVLGFLKERTRKGLRKNAVWVVTGLAIVFAVSISDRLMKSFLPQQTNKSAITVWGISLSAQCALRCDAIMYGTDCSTPEGRNLVENSRCTEFLFGLKNLGEPVIPITGTVSQVFSYLGWQRTLRWLLYAPFTYLRDIHDMEMGLFQFHHAEAASHYPEADAYYKSFFKSKLGTTPKPIFIKLVHYTDYLFKKVRLFHILTGAMVLLCLFTLLFTKLNPQAAFLMFYAVGTYFVLAYVNPHVPFRYLMQILVPGWLGLMLTLIPRQRSLISNV